MSLSPTQLSELQTIVEALRGEFPNADDVLWQGAIRIQKGGLGPVTGAGGQPAFDTALAEIVVCADQISTVQGRQGGLGSSVDQAIFQVVPVEDNLPAGALGDIIYLDMAPNVYAATGVVSIVPAGPNSVTLAEVGTDVARTVPAASGGIEVNNLSTGIGFERVLTTSDSQAHNAEFVTMALSANIPNERVLVGGDGITLTDGGAGGNATLDVDVPLPASTGGDRTLRGDGSGGWVVAEQYRFTFGGIFQIRDFAVGPNTFLLSNNATDAVINTVGLTDLDILGFTRLKLDTESIAMLERAAAPADELTYGQFWVRNDAPNTPMFTDDVGTDFELNALGFVLDQYDYQFSTSVAGSDPGSGFLRFNNAIPASITQLIISDITSSGLDIETDIWDEVVIGSTLRVVDAADLTVYFEFTVTSLFDGSAFRIFSVNIKRGDTLPANNANVIVQVTQAPYFDLANRVPAAGSVMIYNTSTDQFESTENRGTITRPGVGETQFATSDSILRFFSSSRITTNVALHVTEQSATDALILIRTGGNYLIGTGATSASHLDLSAHNGALSVRINEGSTLMILETANALADITGYGQFWVRDDQAPMFTTEGGVDSVLNDTGGQVNTVGGGTNINVSGTAADPIVNLDAAITGVSVNAVTLSAAGAATDYLDETGAYSVPGGAVAISGGPSNNQLAIWTGPATIEGDAALTFDSVTNFFRIHDTVGTSGIQIDHNGSNATLSTFGASPGAIVAGARLVTSASTASRAGFNIQEGVAPSGPVDGDVWVTAAGGYFARLNGVSVDLSAGGSAPIVLLDNEQLQFGTGTDITMDWDGVDMEVEGLAASQIWNWRDGGRHRWYDPTDTEYVEIEPVSATVFNFNLSNSSAGMIFNGANFWRFFDGSVQCEAGLVVNGAIAGGITFEVAGTERAELLAGDTLFILSLIQSSGDRFVVRNGINDMWDVQETGGMTIFEDGAADTDNININHDGTDGNLTLVNALDFNIAGATVGYKFDNSIYILEQAAANADFAGQGQFWVRSSAPARPTYTDDTGVDQLIDPSISEIVSVVASRTLVLTDKGKTIGFTGSTAAQTMTIPASGSVAYQIGTIIAFDNTGSVSYSIAITTDTLRFAADNTTGTRTLAAGGYASAQKVTATEWKIAGSGLT